jgi:hypothetical protein
VVKHSESFGSKHVSTFRGVYAIQGSGLEGFHCTLDFTGANNWSYCNCEISVCSLLIFSCFAALAHSTEEGLCGVSPSSSLPFPSCHFLDLFNVCVLSLRNKKLNYLEPDAESTPTQ